MVNPSTRVLTAGKYRHLNQASSSAGYFNVLAIDHRGNLRKSLDDAAGAPLSDSAFAAFKSRIIRHLAPASTAVLTDPDFGFEAMFVGAGGAGLNKGLLAPLEVTDYSLHASQRPTRFIEGWSVAQLKSSAATGVKLLLYYHPDATNAAQQRALVTRIVEQCAGADIPFFLEPIAYSRIPDQPLSSAELRQVVIESAGTFSRVGVDILKLEFPVQIVEQPDETIWEAALREVDAACSVPWALLSAGAPYPVFKRQVELACQAGASGVIVGRAVWAEAISLQGAAREAFLTTTAVHRVRELDNLCAMYARSWRTRYGAPDLAPGWFRRQ